MGEDGGIPDAVALPIDGVLDLHAFDPREVGALVPSWIEECRRRGILQVRIVHGKGSGALRRTVHALLERHPAVLGFGTADAGAGGWGATEARLRPPVTRGR